MNEKEKFKIKAAVKSTKAVESSSDYSNEKEAPIGKCVISGRMQSDCAGFKPSPIGQIGSFSEAEFQDDFFKPFQKESSIDHLLPYNPYEVFNTDYYESQLNSQQAYNAIKMPKFLNDNVPMPPSPPQFYGFNEGMNDLSQHQLDENLSQISIQELSINGSPRHEVEPMRNAYQEESKSESKGAEPVQEIPRSENNATVNNEETIEKEINELKQLMEEDSNVGNAALIEEKIKHILNESKKLKASLNGKVYNTMKKISDKILWNESTLNDIIRQVSNGRFFGFDFTENRTESVNFLREFNNEWIAWVQSLYGDYWTVRKDKKSN